MSAERFIRIKSSISHDAPENLLLKAGLQLQTGIIGTRVASVPGVVMNSELLGIIPSAVVESLGWSDRIQILPNPTSAEPMEVSLMSRVKQRRTRPQRCCCKQEFQITNYLLVCSATLVPDPPFSSKTRVCNSTNKVTTGNRNPCSEPLPTMAKIGCCVLSLTLTVRQSYWWFSCRAHKLQQ